MDNPCETLIESLTDAQISILESYLRPGLLEDGISLKGIISQDSAILSDRNITHTQVSDRLKTLEGLAKRRQELDLRYNGLDYNPRKKILVDNLLEVGVFTYTRAWLCPWTIEPVVNIGSITPCDCSGIALEVKNLKNGQIISPHGLLAHLIGAHHFFAAAKNWRLDPQKAIDVLDLKPGVDYAPKTAREVIWKFVGYTSVCDKDYIGSLQVRDQPDIKTDFPKGISMYFKADRAVIVAREETDMWGTMMFNGATLFIRKGRLIPGQHILNRETNEYVVG